MPERSTKALEVVEQLGELLRAAGFGGARADELRATGGLLPPAPALEILGRTQDARLALLLTLFSDCLALTRAQAEEVLAPLAVEDLVDAELLEIAGPRVRSRLYLTGFDGLILGGDPDREIPSSTYVKALTMSGKWLSWLTVRHEIQSALDLGTGPGMQALLAARHAERVVAVDVNAHALRLAQTNQRLNRVDDRITWLEGSWLEPLHGERFDLVVSNPPYVISPDNDFIFRDTEAGGDELSRKVVRDCATALNEDGFAIVMCNWIHAEEDWETPVREWVAGLGCDAILRRSSSVEPLSYAMNWNSRLATSAPEEFGESVSRWVDHYRDLRVEQIATGFIVLRRRSLGSNWVVAVDGGTMPGGVAGYHIERIVGAGDFLEAHSGAAQFAALLSSAWSLVDGHRLDQCTVYTDGAYVGRGRMSMQPDTGVHASIDPAVLPVLVACDGRKSFGEIIEGTPAPPGLDRAGFHALCLTTVRDLISRGLLLRAS